MHSYKKGDFETMRKDALRFAKIVITFCIHINIDKRRVARALEISDSVVLVYYFYIHKNS